MKPVVTEQTGKKYKGMMLLGLLICCVGVVLMVAGGYPLASVFSVAGGLVLYGGARLAAWWNHS